MEIDEEEPSKERLATDMFEASMLLQQARKEAKSDDPLAVMLAAHDGDKEALKENIKLMLGEHGQAVGGMSEKVTKNLREFLRRLEEEE